MTLSTYSSAGRMRLPSGIEHHAAAERAQIGLVPNHETIAEQRDDRIVEDQLDQAALLRRDLTGRLQQDDPADGLAGADEETQAAVVLERPFCGLPHLDCRVEARGREVESVTGQHVAAFESRPALRRQD